MKKLVTAIVLFALTFSTVTAQIKKFPKQKIPNNNTFPVTSSNLDLEQIKHHIDKGEFCYSINLGLTAIIPPKNSTPVKAIDAYYSTSKFVKVERNYLRSNGTLLRSDKRFNTSQGNYFEVLIYPQHNDPKKVDKNRVKLTWRIPESQLRTFHLKNVSVRYKPHGILITGDYEVDGIIYGISIALIPNSCLI